MDGVKSLPGDRTTRQTLSREKVCWGNMRGEHKHVNMSELAFNTYKALSVTISDDSKSPFLVPLSLPKVLHSIKVFYSLLQFQNFRYHDSISATSTPYSLPRYPELTTSTINTQNPNHQTTTSAKMHLPTSPSPSSWPQQPSHRPSPPPERATPYPQSSLAQIRP